MERAFGSMANEPASVAYGRLVRLNELLGELRALHASVPGLSHVPATASAESLREALENVRAIIAHAIAAGLSKPNER
jgi:hypothetical protein